MKGNYTGPCWCPIYHIEFTYNYAEVSKSAMEMKRVKQRKIHANECFTAETITRLKASERRGSSCIQYKGMNFSLPFQWHCTVILSQHRWKGV